MNDLSSNVEMVNTFVDWLSTLFSNLSTLFHVVTDLSNTRLPFDEADTFNNVSDF